MVPPSRFYDWFWIFFYRWTRIRGPNFYPHLRSRVIRDSRIFPRFSAKCSFLTKVTNIFSCGLFRSTEWTCKMILQKKKVQKVENSHFGNVLKFQILIFFQFSNILFSHFQFFRWKCDSYGIHIVMFFRAYKCEENGGIFSYILTILHQIYKILHMLQFFGKFWLNIKI